MYKFNHLSNLREIGRTLSSHKSTRGAWHINGRNCLAGSLAWSFSVLPLTNQTGSLSHFSEHSPLSEQTSRTKSKYTEILQWLISHNFFFTLEAWFLLEQQVRTTVPVPYLP